MPDSGNKPHRMSCVGGDDLIETKKLNQLMVSSTLQTTRAPHIFAFGDCAACQQPDGSWAPPRAQSAYQHALYLVRHLPNLVGLKPARKAPPPFIFKDQGHLARLMYWALHKQHQFALGGLRKTLLITLSELIDRTHRPRLKLHWLAPTASPSPSPAIGRPASAIRDW